MPQKFVSPAGKNSSTTQQILLSSNSAPKSKIRIERPTTAMRTGANVMGAEIEEDDANASSLLKKIQAQQAKPAHLSNL